MTLILKLVWQYEHESQRVKFNGHDEKTNQRSCIKWLKDEWWVLVNWSTQQSAQVTMPIF
jgi:hypothetical protein